MPAIFFCRILHAKHNWKESKSQEIYNKLKHLEAAYSCEKCNETFANVDCLKMHVKTVHTERGNGGISLYSK